MPSVFILLVSKGLLIGYSINDILTKEFIPVVTVSIQATLLLVVLIPLLKWILEAILIHVLFRLFKSKHPIQLTFLSRTFGLIPFIVLLPLTVLFENDLQEIIKKPFRTLFFEFLTDWDNSWLRKLLIAVDLLLKGGEAIDALLKVGASAVVPISIISVLLTTIKALIAVKKVINATPHSLKNPITDDLQAKKARIVTISDARGSKLVKEGYLSPDYSIRVGLLELVFWDVICLGVQVLLRELFIFL